MSIAEFRQKSQDELKKEILELRKEQFNLRMQKATGQLENQNRFRQLRREIAQIKQFLLRCQEHNYRSLR
jgi:LSU ribosomal protein L29P